MTRTSTITPAGLVLALLVALSVMIATPSRAAADLQPPLLPEEPPVPQPKVELTFVSGCDVTPLDMVGAAWGIQYQIELQHGPAGDKTYRFQYREPGTLEQSQSPSHQANSIFGFAGLEDVEVRGVVHMLDDPTSFYSDWVFVPAPECNDEPDTEHEPDPEDEPGDNGGGTNPGGQVLGSDIVQANPTFTG